MSKNYWYTLYTVMFTNAHHLPYSKPYETIPKLTLFYNKMNSSVVEEAILRVKQI
jgi:hypothetical protein